MVFRITLEEGKDWGSMTTWNEPYTLNPKLLNPFFGGDHLASLKMSRTRAQKTVKRVLANELPPALLREAATVQSTVKV